MGENRNLKAALVYASKYGWAVFPVKPENKKPYTPHGCRDAKKDAGAIKAWWKKWPNASIGIATGSISSLIVIDEDIDDDKGLDGYMSVCNWEKDNNVKLPETARVITGRGGAHMYYHYDGNDIHNSQGILDGVDVRGEGGYVIAPPSVHPNGTEYAWEDSPTDMPVAEVDDAVKQFISINSTTIREDGERFQLPQIIESGKRNSTLHKFACSLQAQGLSDEAIKAAVYAENNARCVPPVDDDELDLLIGSALKYAKGESKILASTGEEWRKPKVTMKMDKDGNPTEEIAQTVSNCEEVICYDKDLFGRLWYNEMAYCPCVYGNLPWRQHRGWREWDNNDDLNLWSYIEKHYGLKSQEKIMAGLSNVTNKRPMNPIKQMLEEAHNNWDGNKHVEDLLPMLTGARKSEYNTAVIRLFMLGAVSRIYHPGCKFDYMLVLVGPQGKYKSTFFRFLAINEKWFNDNFNSLDGDKAFEKLRGMWIVELSELQATKRAKDVESIKAFITSRDDIYRAPYSRRTEHHPRTCVLAGTSNPVSFLTDRTGNRRFLPVNCWIEECKNPYDDVIGTKAFVMQAWGEIMDEFMRAGGEVPLILPPEIEDKADTMRMSYLEDDPKIGTIQEWLDNLDPDAVPRVCALQIWREVFGNLYGMPQPKEINAIHDIMRNSIKGWHEVSKKQRCGSYGIQKCYEPDVKNVDNVEVPFD